MRISDWSSDVCSSDLSLRPIPITAWLPFSIAMFGIKDYGAIFLICLGAFYPILISTTHGARSLDLNLLRAAQMMGASSRTILFRVVLPNALPAIFAGMRIGAGIAWRSEEHTSELQSLMRIQSAA